MIQPFEVTQLARAGKWDQEPLLDSINKKEYASIILYDRPWSLSDRWTPEMLSAINHSYILADKIADNRVYETFQSTASASLTSCAGAVWRLPSDGSRGIQIQDNGINFFGQGSERKIPVYAVADGLLIRHPDWVDAVAIQHDDPLHPVEKNMVVLQWYGSRKWDRLACGTGFSPGFFEDARKGGSASRLSRLVERYATLAGVGAYALRYYPSWRWRRFSWSIIARRSTRSDTLFECSLEKRE